MLDYCRLCLRKDQAVYRDIMTSSIKCSDLTLIECLYWIFGVEVDLGDEYSKLICSKCEHIVQYVGEFREVYMKNQLILSGQISSYEYLCLSEVTNWRTTRDVGTSVDLVDRDNFRFPEDIKRFYLPKPVKKESKVRGTNIPEHYKTSYNAHRIREYASSAEYVKVPAKVMDKFCPVIRIPRLENSEIREEYEKISDGRYKRRADFKRDHKVAKPRATYVATSMDPVNNNKLTVPIDITKCCFDASLTIPKLEHTNFHKTYERVSETTYRQIRNKYKVRRDQKGLELRKLRFLNYYYNARTSALRELMQEQSKRISGAKVKKDAQGENNSREMTESLIKVGDVFHVEVCTYCSQIFSSKLALDLHYAAKHKKLKKDGEESPITRRVIKRRKKRKARFTFPKSHKLKWNDMCIRQFLINPDVKKRAIRWGSENFPNLNYVREQSQTTRQGAKKIGVNRVQKAIEDAKDRTDADTTQDLDVATVEDVATADETSDTEREGRESDFDENSPSVEETVTRIDAGLPNDTASTSSNDPSARNQCLMGNVVQTTLQILPLDEEKHQVQTPSQNETIDEGVDEVRQMEPDVKQQTSENENINDVPKLRIQNAFDRIKNIQIQLKKSNNGSNADSNQEIEPQGITNIIPSAMHEARNEALESILVESDSNDEQQLEPVVKQKKCRVDTNKKVYRMVKIENIQAQRRKPEQKVPRNDGGLYKDPNSLGTVPVLPTGHILMDTFDEYYDESNHQMKPVLKVDAVPNSGVNNRVTHIPLEDTVAKIKNLQQQLGKQKQAVGLLEKDAVPKVPNLQQLEKQKQSVGLVEKDAIPKNAVVKIKILRTQLGKQKQAVGLLEKDAAAKVQNFPQLRKQLVGLVEKDAIPKDAVAKIKNLQTQLGKQKQAVGLLEKDAAAKVQNFPQLRKQLVGLVEKDAIPKDAVAKIKNLQTQLGKQKQAVGLLEKDAVAKVQNLPQLGKQKQSAGLLEKYTVPKKNVSVKTHPITKPCFVKMFPMDVMPESAVLDSDSNGDEPVEPIVNQRKRQVVSKSSIRIHSMKNTIDKIKNIQKQLEEPKQPTKVIVPASFFQEINNHGNDAALSARDILFDLFEEECQMLNVEETSSQIQALGGDSNIGRKVANSNVPELQIKNKMQLRKLTRLVKDTAKTRKSNVVTNQGRKTPQVEYNVVKIQKDGNLMLDGPSEEVHHTPSCQNVDVVDGDRLCAEAPTGGSSSVAGVVAEEEVFRKLACTIEKLRIALVKPPIENLPQVNIQGVKSLPKKNVGGIKKLRLTSVLKQINKRERTIKQKTNGRSASEKAPELVTRNILKPSSLEVPNSFSSRLNRDAATEPYYNKELSSVVSDEKELGKCSLSDDLEKKSCAALIDLSKGSAEVSCDGNSESVLGIRPSKDLGNDSNSLLVSSETEAKVSCNRAEDDGNSENVLGLSVPTKDLENVCSTGLLERSQDDSKPESDNNCTSVLKKSRKKSKAAKSLKRMKRPGKIIKQKINRRTKKVRASEKVSEPLPRNILKPSALGVLKKSFTSLLNRNAATKPEYNEKVSSLSDDSEKNNCADLLDPSKDEVEVSYDKAECGDSSGCVLEKGNQSNDLEDDSLEGKVEVSHAKAESNSTAESPRNNAVTNLLDSSDVCEVEVSFDTDSKSVLDDSSVQEGIAGQEEKKSIAKKVVIHQNFVLTEKRT